MTGLEFEEENEKASQESLVEAEKHLLRSDLYNSFRAGGIKLEFITGLHSAGLNDVRRDMKSYRMQVVKAHLFQETVPVARLSGGQDIPISLGAGPDFNDTIASPSQFRSMRNRETEIVSRAQIEVVQKAPEAAVTNFLDQLSDFLALRINAARTALGYNRKPPSLSIGVPGLNVRVETLGAGLQVIASPAYFLNRAAVFGNSLSSPVDGLLQPGIYLFGGHASGAPGPTWEHTPHNIPPTHLVRTIRI